MEIATLYERTGEHLTAQCITPAFDLVGRVGTGTDVLDVACGPGGLSVAAAGLGARVTAIDVGEAMVARAAQRLEPYPSCSATVMDARALEFDDDTFDIAFSMFGVINLPEWRSALGELARVTRPGGRGCISSWKDPRTVAAVTLLVEATAEVFPDREPVPVPDGVRLAANPAALHELMAHAGFDDISVEPVQVTWNGPTVRQFIEELDQVFGFMPAYASLTSGERESLAPALLRAAERRAGPDGSLRITTVAHLAAGRV
ncbi:methyltransferase domain-containing protein [Mycolicibacterium sp. 018/SC-01/001]|uniref:class I SAM-dependent methyltransferase n=1 Tax=Mycolicibacterium sp. 018/SC-01/001 TaxID=2592069 RepID=UPI00117EEB56|nr:class I SAM-dependent methyltransferase [Mycolicibacterium sp. 018/SC-01/001]TRW89090.1 methyltransferase domain-containing protein [Mycolicibacterium sp. 018/SC-01/001]